ncbi:CopM family metallochaperone [Psychrobacter celer]|uniref:CopM family metallochaperone n=1 Tax=Psychrobacter celer TaxID=306572 RepID=UPI003FD25CD2
MIASRRFSLLATSIAAALILSACQPATEDEATPSDTATPPMTDLEVNPADAQTDDGLAKDDAANETQMTDMLRDYTRAMTRMHDEMMIGMGYNDPDTAFAKAMLGHHRGAIEMAKIQLKHGTDDSMRQLAQNVIDAQQLELDTLNKWLASHPDTVKTNPHTEAMQQAYARSMDVLHGDMVLGIADPQPDMAFARGMLPHHIGAVDMANVQLKYGTDEEMRQLAQSIIDTQQAEIELMQNWIANRSADAAETNTNADADSMIDASDDQAQSSQSQPSKEPATAPAKDGES